MRILIGSYPWSFDCPGGGERQLCAYYEHLRALGVSVNLFDQWKPEFRKHDVFHFFSVMPGSFQLCEHAKKQGLRLVISPNLWVTEETKYWYPHDEIKRLLAIADRVVVNSKLEAESLARVYELPLERFSVVYNGVEDLFLGSADGRDFRSRYGLENQRYLLNVANIEPRKNQLRLIEAVKRFPDLKLVVIGLARDEAYRDECFRLAGDQLIFAGELPYGSPLLHSAYAGCEAFVMPSTLETPSIAALEAAATGAKIVITNVGSTTEYFDDQAEYVAPDSTQSIAEAIDRALQSSGSFELKNRIGQRFTWRAIANDLREVYRSEIDIAGRTRAS
ncbi:glycosyltransferase [Burkholderia ubonensis]|uniref:Glycosyltransferase n=1 Tax=Burkholderia ubonensis subsp. mesacidophila TaxID=265293 RepID=A0A2A4F7S2_9BURK|nr:glycosyltransferase [Burkholderia ubonensis]PCE29037.1 glycosyltransferase [Burkholderia ubonensis subsp. mesacidophila]